MSTLNSLKKLSVGLLSTTCLISSLPFHNILAAKAKVNSSLPKEANEVLKENAVENLKENRQLLEEEFEIVDNEEEFEIIDNIDFSFDKNKGVLTVSGTGKMVDYKNNSLKSNVTSLFSRSGNASKYNDDYTKSPINAYRNKIKKIIFEEGIESVGRYAFYNCQNLKSITLSSTIIEVGKCAFDDCKKLKNITFKGNTPIKFGQKAFGNLNNKVTIEIPEGSTYESKAIEPDSKGQYKAVFNNAKVEIVNNKLGNDITYEISNGKLTISGSGNMYDYDVVVDRAKLNGMFSTSPLYEYRNKIKSIEFKKGSKITSIGAYVFYECENLKEVTIPSSIKSINEGAFLLSGLEKVYIPSNIRQIGKSAFEGCYDIKEVRFDLNNKSIQINDSAFGSLDENMTIVLPKEAYVVDEDLILDEETRLLAKEMLLGCFGEAKVTIDGEEEIVDDKE